MPVTLADHPVLEILNTAMVVDGEPVDLIGADADVLPWLAKMGWPAPERFAGRPYLARAFRRLRDEIRRLIELRKEENSVDVAGLNTFLAAARSHMALVPGKNGAVRVIRKWQQRTPEELLAPLAEAAAELLATGDFELIRKCESEDCVLWFYDRTKSHHRRWCSMATCGNRHKVTAFRQRRQQGKPQ